MENNTKPFTCTVIISLFLTTHPVITSTHAAGEPQNFAEIDPKNAAYSFMLAQKLEHENKIEQAMQIYDCIYQSWNEESRWSQLAAMNLGRCLLCENPPKIQKAKQLINFARPLDYDFAFSRKRQLWAMFINIHVLCTKWLDTDIDEFSVSPHTQPSNWRIPDELIHHIDPAMIALADRFNKNYQRAVEFFHKLFHKTSNHYLQQGFLPHLLDVQLKAGHAGDALITARAYWLIAVSRPILLPDAIDKLVLCMKKLGAGPETIKQFRYFQTYGRMPEGISNESIVRNPIRLIKNSGQKVRPLFPAETINKENSQIEKARLLLLNGRLSEAAKKLKVLIEDTQPETKKWKYTLELIRMSLALHDGHVHNTDRYELYLYEKSGPTQNTNKTDPANPLDLIIKNSGYDISENTKEKTSKSDGSNK